MNFSWNSYINDFEKWWPELTDFLPWQLPAALSERIVKIVATLNADYEIKDGLAIHKTAQVEPGVILKAPLIVGPNCFIASHAYLRGGVWLAGGNSIGPGCEIKSSLLAERTNLAHFNFVGDSVLGTGINMEAGSVIANHFNERINKAITVRINNEVMATGAEKFGALVGDGSKIGANAVLSPGTILLPNTIVNRLELI